MKLFFKRLRLQNIIKSLDSGKTKEEAFGGMSVLDAILMLHSVWTNDIKPSTIQNCFRKAGFAKTSNNIPALDLIDLEAIEVDAMESMQGDWSVIEKLIEDHVTLTDFINVDTNVVAMGSLSDQQILDETAEELMEVETIDDPIVEGQLQHEELVEPTDEEIQSAKNVFKRLLLTGKNTPLHVYNALSTVNNYYA